MICVYTFHQKKERNKQTNKMACAPSKDSDQPGHTSSLIRVFAVRMTKAWVLTYLSIERASKTMISLGGCPADLSLRLVQRSVCWLSPEAAHIL